MWHLSNEGADLKKECYTVQMMDTLGLDKLTTDDLHHSINTSPLALNASLTILNLAIFQHS